MKLIRTLLLPVLFVAMWSLTGCNEEPTTSVTPDNTTSLSKLEIPEGAVISSATFNIYVEDPYDHNITVHQVNVPWVEATETWNIFFGKPADQFEAASLGGFNAGTPGLKTVDITALVQGWVDGTIDNNGVLLNQAVAGGWINNYLSKEYGDGSFAPYLEVTYTVGVGAPETVQEPAFGDTYISTLFKDTPYGSEIYLLNGRPLVDYIKYVLVQFDIESTPVEEECETAYAYSDEDPDGTCFIDLGFGNWGWSIYLPVPDTYIFEVWAAAGQCNLNNGTHVGNIEVVYAADGTVTFDLTLFPGFTLDEEHYYAGETPTPLNKQGKPTVAPGSYTISNIGTDGGYIIAHAVVCSTDWD